MDLLVASMQCAGVIDQRSSQDVGVGQVTLVIGLDERAVVVREELARSDGRSVSDLPVGVASDVAEQPCLERIDVCRLLAALGMLAAWLAAIFNVDAEEDSVLAATLLIGARAAID